MSGRRSESGIRTAQEPAASPPRRGRRCRPPRARGERAGRERSPRSQRARSPPARRSACGAPAERRGRGGGAPCSMPLGSSPSTADAYWRRTSRTGRRRTCSTAATPGAAPSPAPGSPRCPANCGSDEAGQPLREGEDRRRAAARTDSQNSSTLSRKAVSRRSSFAVEVEVDGPLGHPGRRPRCRGCARRRSRARAKVADGGLEDGAPARGALAAEGGLGHEKKLSSAPGPPPPRGRAPIRGLRASRYEARTSTRCPGPGARSSQRTSEAGLEVELPVPAVPAAKAFT